jgi:uncharacterized SAM-binding protein YcdF (DUF218 family)
MTYVKSAFRISCAVAIAMALYVGLTFITVLFVGHTDDGNKADAVVVLGAAQYDGTPSPLLESRLQHALDLYSSGRVTFIAVTGGKKPGDRFTEAAASRRWLTDRGVPTEVIIREDEGRSTWESMSNVAAILSSRDIQTVLVSTDRWHMQRCVLSLRELGIHAEPSATSTSPLQGAKRAWNKYVKETVGVAVGRIIGFDRLLSITG